MTTVFIGFVIKHLWI